MDDDGNGDILMEIEVKFGKGRSDSVLVRRDDDPSDLAQVSQYYIQVTYFPSGSNYMTLPI